MTTTDDKDERSQSPGLAMRLATSGIRKTFPSVQNITTGLLAKWQRGLPPLAVPGERPLTYGAALSNGDCDTDDPRELILLDARPEEEYRVGHISGSVRVDYEAAPDDIAATVPGLVAPDDRTAVVCYCSVGYRSCMVAKKLEGFYKRSGVAPPRVYNLEGSLFQWANEGRPMTDGCDRPTKYAHPYNAVFGKLLNSELRQTQLEPYENGPNKL